MNGFHDVRLPLRFSLGARVSLERRIDVTRLANGQEVRNAPWARSRRRYDLSGVVQGPRDAADIVAFFEARQGRLFAFRFRDPLDHTSAPDSVSAPQARDQVIGTGDGATTVFSVCKQYQDTSATHRRAITHPVGDSVTVAINGIVVPGSGYTIDAQQGQLHFVQAPATGVVITAGFAFDVPVRFDMDKLELSQEAPEAIRARNISLLEVWS